MKTLEEDGDMLKGSWDLCEARIPRAREDGLPVPKVPKEANARKILPQDCAGRRARRHAVEPPRLTAVKTDVAG